MDATYKPDAKKANTPGQDGIFGKAEATTNATAQAPHLTSPRERRLLTALLEGQQSREILDRRIGASNTPDVVFRLRTKGFGILCERIEVLDRDGLPCRPGVYSLTSESRLAAILALSSGEVV